MDHGGKRTAISPLALVNPAPDLVVAHTLDLEVGLVEVLAGADGAEDGSEERGEEGEGGR